MRRHSVETFDAAIVLGAMVAPDGSPSPALLRRVLHGVELVRRGTARNLLMSGGPVSHPRPEAHVMRDIALARGISADAVHVEDRSRNTIQNALLSAPMAAERGWRRLAVVTDRYHLPRALYVFRRLGLDVAGAAPPPPHRREKEWWLAYLREAGALPWTMVRLERSLLLES